MNPSAAIAAETACTEGRCEEAIELLERALLAEPDNFELLYRLGVCYGGGCRHPLTRPDMAIPYLRRALRLAPEGSRAAVLDALGNTLIESREAPREAALREAVECHCEAAAIYRAQGDLEDWARVEFNLGNFCCELSDWQAAVSHYRQSLAVRTRAKDPARHAAVLENLGTAYRHLATAEDIKKSISCYRRALWDFRPGQPSRNASVENNLGNAFLSLPGAAARNARRALVHFERALRILGDDKTCRTWAITQYNRAHAYLRLGRNEAAAACLRESSAAFRACGDFLCSEQAERLSLGFLQG